MRRSFFVGVVLLAAAFVLSGCTTWQLSAMKKHSAKQDFEWIAKKKVTCKPIDDGCNQIHLIQGDACFRLAKANKEPKKHYQCAVQQLEAGVAQTREWKMEGLNLGRAQTYENLCESIRNLLDLESGPAADELTKKLFVTSQTFLSLEPDNLAALYFKNSARFTSLRRCLLHPENCPTLCEALRSMNGELDRAMVTALQSKYKDSFHRLHTDIEGAKKAVRCQ